MNGLRETMIRRCSWSQRAKPNLILGVSLAVQFLFAVAAVAPAQTQTAPESTIHFISKFTAPGQPVPHECIQQGIIVQKLLTLYEHPAAWRWIVVCDESEWSSLERHVGLQLTPNHEILGFTNLDARATCVRGWTLLNPIDISPEMQADHTIRHELGHILEMTGDENVAERRARLLLKQRLIAQKAPGSAQRAPIAAGQ